MMTILVIECVALLVLLICSAFFSSAETAFFSLNPLQIQHIRASDPESANRIKRMLDLPTQLLSTILIGNTLVNVTTAGLGFAIVKHFDFVHPAMVSIPLVTGLLLIFGEVAPKRIAMSRPERLAISYAWLLTVLIRLFTPMRTVLQKIAALFEKDLHAADKSLTEDEFRTVVEVGEMEGVLDEEERTMVDGIIRLEETEARDVMTPRVDLIGIDLDDTQEEQEKTAERTQFRYLPVYRDSLDEPEGFLDVPRFLLSINRNLDAAMVPPFFIPETAPLDDLLATFQKENRRVAFVTDEYGGTAGLITRGDILEEIIDDVDNEYGKEHLTLQRVGKDRWLVDGSTSLEDINYELDLDLEEEGADRVAGWVIAEAEHIPKVGEVINHQGCRVTVQRVKRNRITLVLLEKLKIVTPTEEGGEE
ncbi:MAG: HlyC/CorC family transporter [Kiritimatiellae bacterium]|nr:HlyC/CorC family transporter [Kiritimatiellia bacterium]